MTNYLPKPGGAQLRNYEPPWYDRAVNSLTDYFYGPSANAQDRSWVNKLAGPENPFNLPAQASQGVNTAVDGYNQGDYGQMAMGVAQTGLAASPLLGARAMMPSVRNAATARAKHGMFPDEASAFSGRAGPLNDDFMVLHHPGRSNAPPSMPQPANSQTPSRFEEFAGMRLGPAGQHPPETSPVGREMDDVFGALPTPRGASGQEGQPFGGVFQNRTGATMNAQDAYSRYVQMTGDDPGIAKFGRMMANAGYRKAKVSGRVRYIGIE